MLPKMREGIVQNQGIVPKNGRKEDHPRNESILAEDIIVANKLNL
jgi:hypothetical protein